MKGFREENSSCCFHQEVIFVGVCPLCLNERLLIVAVEQSKQTSSVSVIQSLPQINSQTFQDLARKRKLFNFPKIFTFSSSFFNRFEFRRSEPDQSDDHDGASTSQEDSFISIKFGDEGNSLWDKREVSNKSVEHCSVSWKNRKMNDQITTETNNSVVEIQKQRRGLTWRKRIGQLFRLIRLKRSTMCHASSRTDRAKTGKGWISPLTKRKDPKSKIKANS